MTKITQEEQQFVQQLQEKYSELTIKLGQVNMEIYDLESSLNELNSIKNDLLDQYKQSRMSESEFINTLSEKYGTGNLNLETGEFVPSN
jgi:chaperonin cofactor prefoldin